MPDRILAPIEPGDEPSFQAVLSNECCGLPFGHPLNVETHTIELRPYAEQRDHGTDGENASRKYALPVPERTGLWNGPFFPDCANLRSQKHDYAEGEKGIEPDNPDRSEE